MYSATGYASTDDLVARYAPLVKRIAYHLVGRLPASVMVDDLIQAGMLGLLDASTHYDKRQGASFETYATIRIRGAMIDELRRNDWAPKSLHKRARELAEAIARVEAATGRDARDQEVATELGVPLEEYHRLLQETNGARMLSFDDLGGDDPVALFSSDEQAPAEQFEEERFRQQLVQAIDSLPERERLIMALYYEEELNLREIGAVLNVSESRISQLLSQAHLRLRGRLTDWVNKG